MADHHGFVHGFAHIVDRQSGHRDSRQSLHFDPGLAFDFDDGLDPHQGLFSIRDEINLDAVNHQRVA